MASITTPVADNPAAPPPERLAATPFEQQRISISKAEYIQLKWDAHYWRLQFGKLNDHRNLDMQRLKDEMACRAECAGHALSKLQEELERVRAQVKDFQKRLFG